MADTTTAGPAVEDDSIWPHTGAYVLLSGGLSMVFLAAATIASSPTWALPALAAPAVVALGLGFQRRIDWRAYVGTRFRGDVTLVATASGPFVVVLAMVLAGHTRQFEPHVDAVSSVALGTLAEVGWWGYLYPLLRRQAQPLPASMMIGLVWSAWHAALAWAGTNPLAGATPALLVGWALSLAFLSAAILEFRPRSILPVVLFHLGLDAAVATLGFAPGEAGTLAPMRIGTALIAAGGIATMVIARREAVARARHARSMQ